MKPSKVLVRLMHVEHLTTGEAAQICGVSQQTIIRSFDEGLLVGFRVPGSRFRRIPRANLRAYMIEHGIPTGPLDEIEDPAEAPLAIPAEAVTA
jgi:excisionase family DNA binding protein